MLALSLVTRAFGLYKTYGPNSDSVVYVLLDDGLLARGDMLLPPGKSAASLAVEDVQQDMDMYCTALLAYDGDVKIELVANLAEYMEPVVKLAGGEMYDPDPMTNMGVALEYRLIRWGVNRCVKVLKQYVG